MHLLNRLMCRRDCSSKIQKVIAWQCAKLWHEQRVHVPATVGGWCVVAQVQFPFWRRKAILSLWMLLAATWHELSPLFGELSQAKSKPLLSQEGIVSFKVHKFTDLSRDRSENWTPWKDVRAIERRCRFVSWAGLIVEAPKLRSNITKVQSPSRKCSLFLRIIFPLFYFLMETNMQVLVHDNVANAIM